MKNILGFIAAVLVILISAHAGAVTSGNSEFETKTPPSQYTDPVTGMEFVWVPGGCYVMGDFNDDVTSDSFPAHEVCLDGFYMGKYPVTLGQWITVMGNNPSHITDCCLDFPVNHVSWNDAQQFITKLNGLSSKPFRLPTEAEWEYAARSGGKKERWAGTDHKEDLLNYAWEHGNTEHPVGRKYPNGLGLYDMSGNIGSWTNDWYGDYDNDFFKLHPKNPKGPLSGTKRVIRDFQYPLTTSRDQLLPEYSSMNLGFRIVFNPYTPENTTSTEYKSPDKILNFARSNISEDRKLNAYQIIIDQYPSSDEALTSLEAISSINKFREKQEWRKSLYSPDIWDATSGSFSTGSLSYHGYYFRISPGADKTFETTGYLAKESWENTCDTVMKFPDTCKVIYDSGIVDNFIQYKKMVADNWEFSKLARVDFNDALNAYLTEGNWGLLQSTYYTLKGTSRVVWAVAVLNSSEAVYQMCKATGQTVYYILRYPVSAVVEAVTAPVVLTAGTAWSFCASVVTTGWALPFAGVRDAVYYTGAPK